MNTNKNFRNSISILLFAAVVVGLQANVSLADPPSVLNQVGDGVLLEGASWGEVSGIVASRMSNNLFWAHDDSDGHARVLAVRDEIVDAGVTLAPKIIGSYSFSTNCNGRCNNRDFEDISIGVRANRNSSESWLYVADTGNNAQERDVFKIIRIKEPTLSSLNPASRYEVNLPKEEIETLYFTFKPGYYQNEGLYVRSDDPVVGFHLGRILAGQKSNATAQERSDAQASLNTCVQWPPLNGLAKFKFCYYSSDDGRQSVRTAFRAYEKPNFDIEAIAVDPSGDLYFLTKRFQSGSRTDTTSILFKIDASSAMNNCPTQTKPSADCWIPASTARLTDAQRVQYTITPTYLGAIAQLNHMTKVKVAGTTQYEPMIEVNHRDKVSAMDISPSGRSIAVLTYKRVFQFSAVSSNNTVEEIEPKHFATPVAIGQFNPPGEKEVVRQAESISFGKPSAGAEPNKIYFASEGSRLFRKFEIPTAGR